MSRNERVIGWVQAFFSVLILWGVNNVYVAFCARVLEANYIIYSCSAFASCAFILLLVSGRGPLVRETLRSIDTWFFGLALLIGYILTFSLFSLVSATEGSLLQRVSLIFGIIASWIFWTRAPGRQQLFGALLVLGGIGLVLQGVEASQKGLVFLLMFLEGLALTLRMFAAESHRPHQAAMQLQHDPRAKARVVGFVMFVISVLFMGLFLMFALFQSLSPTPTALPIVPQLSDFTDSASIFAGLVGGVFLIAPLRLIEFSATKRIKTENFLAVAGLSSMATLFWEWALSPLTGMSLRSISEQDLLALGLVTVGAVVAAVGKMRQSEERAPQQKYLEQNPQDVSAVEDTRDLVAHTLEYTEGDVKRAAELLDVPSTVLKQLIDDDSQTLAFKPKVYVEVARRYRKSVASADNLTGLNNRATFMAAVEGAVRRQEKCAVVYLDLNSFKPINDRYEHKAGDEVLREVGRRLDGLNSPQVLAGRLGGDEFALLVLGPLVRMSQFVAEIKGIIAQPIKLKDSEEVAVSASVGVAQYPKDARTAQALVAAADAAMYSGKTGR